MTNPTTQPQPTAEDMQIAGTIRALFHGPQDQDASVILVQVVTGFTHKLRLSNEALREWVKQLEGVLMVQNDKVCIHHNDAERLKIFDGCPICKLTDANERVKELELTNQLNGINHQELQLKSQSHYCRTRHS